MNVEPAILSGVRQGLACVARCSLASPGVIVSGSRLMPACQQFEAVRRGYLTAGRLTLPNRRVLSCCVRPCPLPWIRLWPSQERLELESVLRSLVAQDPTVCYAQLRAAVLRCNKIRDIPGNPQQMALENQVRGAERGRAGSGWR